MAYVITRRLGDNSLSYLGGDAIPRASVTHANTWPTKAQAETEIAALAKAFGKKWAAGLRIELIHKA